MAQKAQIVLEYSGGGTNNDTFTLLMYGNSRTFKKVATLGPFSANAREYNSFSSLLDTLSYYAYGRYSIVQTGSQYTLTALAYGSVNDFGTVTFSGSPGVTVISQQDNISPVCDLAITSVATTGESAPGGNGIAQVFATSSNGPIQYSLDNSSWQSSSSFSALAGGSYTAYVKDDLSCLANQAFSISAYVPPAPVLGCTNPAASNYNPAATQDDGTCVFPPAPVYDVMHPITIEVRRCIEENPVMLVWKNNLGGRNHWLFSYRQQVGRETTELGLYELYSDELETQQVQQQTLGRLTLPTMVIGADNLSRNQYETISGIVDSPFVERLFQDGKRYRVIVRTGSLPAYDTQDSTHGIELTIELPRVNNITN
jgi:hypothetical protein